MRSSDLTEVKSSKSLLWDNACAYPPRVGSVQRGDPQIPAWHENPLLVYSNIPNHPRRGHIHDQKKTRVRVPSWLLRRLEPALVLDDANSCAGGSKNGRGSQLEGEEEESD